MNYILLPIYYLLMIYYLLIIIFFIMNWIPPLCRTGIYRLLYKITLPFNKIFLGKFIIGGFDFGGTLGLILLGGILYFLGRLL